MRRFVFLFCFLSTQLLAQAPFDVCDSVNINRINARVLVHGDVFHNLESNTPACEFPAGSGKHINFASSLWMSGYDSGGQLHVSAQTYRERGNDYWPGPLDTADTLTYATSQNWAKIWKVNRADIQLFQSMPVHTTMNTPLNILTWPANGNIDAEGNGGIPLVIDWDMAPFVDLNGNGIYEPILGEYPDIKGDQALWWVYSDNGPTHSESNGKPLGLEIHAMAYAYNRGTLIDNVIYFDYKILNRSVNNYDSLRIGVWDDVEIGSAYDDYVGFDSSHRMGIGYNGDDCDDCSGGASSTGYGLKIPMVGMTMIVLPGDSSGSYIPAGEFIAYENGFSVIGNPNGDIQYNYYLRGKDAAGQLFYDLFSLRSQCRYHDPNQFYFYSGDPSDIAGCSECSLNQTPADMRFLIGSHDFSLLSGGTAHVVAALVTTSPDILNGCGEGGGSFDSIKIVADTAWAIYFNPLPPNEVDYISQVRKLSINPNPAHNELLIEGIGRNEGGETITVYNTLGQIQHPPLSWSGGRYIIDVSQLAPGLYGIVYRNGAMQCIGKFVKE